MTRWATRLHAWVYRRSGGRSLGRMGGQPVLLLQTTGRRSGRTCTTPVQYLADGDTSVVVASNGGAARPPAWYLNLRANPHARIWVGARRIDVRAQEAAGQERAALWRRFILTPNRYLERAAFIAGRDLPSKALVSSTPPLCVCRRLMVTTTPDLTRRFSSHPPGWFLNGLSGATSATPSATVLALPNGVRVVMSGRIKIGLGFPPPPSRRSTGDPSLGEPTSGSGG